MPLCKKCGCADASQFYGSISTYCKTHWRERASENRRSKPEQYRAYEAKRAKTPKRIASTTRTTKAWREKNPKRWAAHIALNNAIRSGQLVRQPCFICGETAVAHHPDYDQPLSVVWLCEPHHKAAHRAAKG